MHHIMNTVFLELEILQIEAVFLEACGYSFPLHHKGVKPSTPNEK